MPAISLHTACGTHAKQLSHGIPGEAEIAVQAPSLERAWTHISIT